MRKIILALVGCFVVLILGYAGYRGFKVWKQHRMMHLAQEYLQRSDGRNALLCLQQVLAVNPRHLEAARLMASLAEGVRSPAALLWRSRVVEINPESLDDRLALAETALLLKDSFSASKALEAVSEKDKQTAKYHRVAGEVWAALGQLARAENEFLEACRLEPQDKVGKLNLAIVRLHGTNTPVLQEARNTLSQFSSSSTNASQRCQALRELAVDAMRYKHYDQALTLSDSLVRQSNSIFSDRLLRLQILRDTTNATFKPALAAYQKEAASAPGSIYELGVWMLVNTSPGDTLAWLRALPSAVQTNPPVPVLCAQCLINMQDWRGLQTALQRQQWGEMEFMRHALLARALRGQEMPGAAAGEWEMAMKLANSQKQAMRMLLALTAQWKWQSESEDVLWAFVDHYPDEKWAVRALSQALYQGGRTRPLMALYAQLGKANPSDLSTKNNLAMTALLLDAQEHKPHVLAQQVYDQAGTNSTYASTYAFSLYLQNKRPRALEVMQKLKPKELEDPSVAGYYGLILKAAGDKTKARQSLEMALKGSLLPEEKKLFEQARAGI